MSHLMNTYARLPVAFTHGQGARVFDEAGRGYLDALSGIAVSTLGHAHPRLVKAIADQAGRILHASNLYRIREQEQLGDRLAPRCRAWTRCSSATPAARPTRPPSSWRACTATEGHRLPAIVVMEKAFHGRTLATLSATGNRKVQAGFEPLVGGLRARALRRHRGRREGSPPQHNVVAVMLEPIQGEGGINVAHANTCSACAASATNAAGCSCSTRSSAAWAAPASGSPGSMPASSPT
jgi:acetylornithine/N-succinyldiaminopimelate aminotransferase